MEFDYTCFFLLLPYVLPGIPGCCPHLVEVAQRRHASLLLSVLPGILGCPHLVEVAQRGGLPVDASFVLEGGSQGSPCNWNYDYPLRIHRRIVTLAQSCCLRQSIDQAQMSHGPHIPCRLTQHTESGAISEAPLEGGSVESS